MQIVAFLIYLVFPFTIPVIIANILLRGTAQGATFGLARVLLGIWSFFVPVLASTGIKPVATILMAFLIVSGVVGYLFMPNSTGKSLPAGTAGGSAGRAAVPATASGSHCSRSWK